MLSTFVCCLFTDPLGNGLCQDPDSRLAQVAACLIYTARAVQVYSGIGLVVYKVCISQSSGDAVFDIKFTRMWLAYITKHASTMSQGMSSAFLFLLHPHNSFCGISRELHSDEIALVSMGTTVVMHSRANIVLCTIRILI